MTLAPRRAFLLAALAALAAPFALPAAADPVADFYKGQDLTILIGHPPGGSYDLYAQLAAAHLGRHLPGNPKVIVQHMPGGGGARATAHFYNRAPQDGVMIALFPEVIGFLQLMDPKNARWDVGRMRYIGSFAPSNAVLMRRKDAPAKSVADLFTVTSNVGCTGRSSQSFQYPSALKVLAGAKFNIICGYDGSAAYTLALLRGEVDMVSKAWAAWRAEDKDTIDAGTFVPMVQGGLKRLSDLPDVPLMQEVARDADARRALEFMSAGSAIGRALLAPPNVPAERLAALRAAFDAMVRDEAFIADVKKRNLPLDPSPGAEVQGYSDAIVKTPKDVLELTAKAFAG